MQELGSHNILQELMDFENQIMFAENIMNRETHSQVNTERRRNTVRELNVTFYKLLDSSRVAYKFHKPSAFHV